MFYDARMAAGVREQGKGRQTHKPWPGSGVSGGCGRPLLVLVPSLPQRQLWSSDGLGAKRALRKIS